MVSPQWGHLKSMKLSSVIMASMGQFTTAAPQEPNPPGKASLDPSGQGSSASRLSLLSGPGFSGIMGDDE
jgi:hypothetical protein